MPATGTDIPPELWPRILEYVGTKAGGEGEDWERTRGHGLRDLKSCSLVCIDWENRCRHIIFTGIWIRVRSQEQIESLDFYAKHGSNRLVPISHRIYRWTPEQTWASRSWCHLCYNSSLHLKSHDTDGVDLTLVGPVPSSLPVSALHSPHWSIPRSMPACYISFTTLVLKDIHFPSLSSLFKLVRHFKSLCRLYLVRITWDQVEIMAPVPRSRITNLVVISHGCTDNRYASVSLAALCPGSAFW